MSARYLLVATHVPASGAGGGMVRYTVELARALRDDFADRVDLHVLTTADGARFFRAELGPDRVHTVPALPTAARSALERWAPLSWFAGGGWDVVHGPKHLLPRSCGAARRVLTVHDLVLFERPGDFGVLKRALLARPYRASIREGDVLVCASEATRAALTRREPGAAARSAAVPLALSRALLECAGACLPALAGRRFALVVGDASARKNLALPVGMWRDVRDRVPDAVLVVVGPPDWWRAHRGDRWADLLAEGAIHAPGHVSDAELRWLYEHAAVVLCPSLLEGFGLPALEGRAFGAPVITSTDPALTEASAGAPAIPVDDVDSWVAATVRALRAGRTRGEGTASPVRSWDDVAAETVDAVAAACPGARRPAGLMTRAHALPAVFVVLLTVAVALVVGGGRGAALPAGCTGARPAGTATGDLVVTDHGAVADDAGDDTAAIQRALDALAPGQSLAFPPGCYLHDDTLTVTVPGSRITGAGARLVATREERSALAVDADDVVVEGLELAVPRTSKRWEAAPQHALRIAARDGVAVRDVAVLGSAASGVFVDGASNFVLDRVTVSDTRADGIHLTGGARHGVVNAPVVTRSGDDGVAVVSYADGSPPCRWITVQRPVVRAQTWGRGVSVVGGEDITFSEIDIADSDSAAVYVATEGAPYFTRSVARVAVVGGRVTGSNRNPGVDHGAVLVYSGRPRLGVTDVEVRGLTIAGTARSARRDVGVISGGGGVDGIRLDDLTVERPTARVLEADVDRSRYSARRWIVDGRAVPAPA